MKSFTVSGLNIVSWEVGIEFSVHSQLTPAVVALSHVLSGLLSSWNIHFQSYLGWKQNNFCNVSFCIFCSLIMALFQGTFQMVASWFVTALSVRTSTGPPTPVCWDSTSLVSNCTLMHRSKHYIYLCVYTTTTYVCILRQRMKKQVLFVSFWCFHKCVFGNSAWYAVFHCHFLSAVTCRGIFVTISLTQL